MKTASFQSVVASPNRRQLPCSRFAPLLAAIFALMTWAAPHLSAAPLPPHKVTILPDIPGAVDRAVIDSNNHGQILGSYSDGPKDHGFIYDKSV